MPIVMLFEVTPVVLPAPAVGLEAALDPPPDLEEPEELEEPDEPPPLEVPREPPVEPPPKLPPPPVLLVDPPVPPAPAPPVLDPVPAPPSPPPAAATWPFWTALRWTFSYCPQDAATSARRARITTDRWGAPAMFSLSAIASG